jgi:hypothetical protein
MPLRRSLVPSLLAAALCAGTVTAQDLSVSADVARPGDAVDVKYSNPSMAGQSVKIEISNSDPVRPRTVVFEITLDESGGGSFTWIVEDWDWAEISAPGARDATIYIR